MPDEKFMLRFEPDTVTGLPHLVDPSGCLSASVHADWEAELNARCNDQSLRGDRTIRFATRAKNVPSEFRVRAEYGANNRMPIYVLEPIVDASPSAVPTEATRWSAPLEAEQYWPAGFLMAARNLAREQQADRMGRHGLQFVIEEIHDLAKDYPGELVVLLVSSYTAIRKLACAGNPTLAREEQFYDRALEALEFPLRGLAPESHAGTLGSLLGAVSRYLGRKRSS
jgi:hypothetical protein